MTSPPLLQNTALDILHSPLHSTFCFFPSQMSLSSVVQQCGPNILLWPQLTTLICTWQIRHVFSSSTIRSVAYLFFSLTSMIATLIHFKSRKQVNAQRSGGPSCLTHHSLPELWVLQPAVSWRNSPETHPRDSEENRVGCRGRPKEEEQGKIDGKKEQEHLDLSLIRMSWGLLEKCLCLWAAAYQHELFLLKQLIHNKWLIVVTV